jgi:hypothetical protein
VKPRPRDGPVAADTSVMERVVRALGVWKGCACGKDSLRGQSEGRRRQDDDRANLAAGLARGGLRTLLLDLDPQCNATTGFGATPAPTHPLVSESPLRRPSWPPAFPISPSPGKPQCPRRGADRGRGPERVDACARKSSRPRTQCLGLLPDRLPAECRRPDADGAGREHRGADADPMRILRARGTHPDDRGDPRRDGRATGPAAVQRDRAHDARRRRWN